MITKQDFLAGKEFTVKGEYSNFQYDTSVKCLSIQNFMEWSHYANIENITEKGFHCLRFLFSKRVKAFVPFTSCTLVNP